MGLGFIPQRVPPGYERLLQGSRGPAPSPAPAALPRCLTADERGFWGGRRETQKCPGSALFFPLRLNCHTDAFSSPRGPSHAARLPSSQGRETVPPSTKTRRGDGGTLCGATLAAGRPARRGSPAGKDPSSQLRSRGGGLSPHPPGRGCGARLWEKCSPRLPGVCAVTLRCGAHTRVWDTHMHLRGGVPPV